MSNTGEHVFVYGTLRSGQASPFAALMAAQFVLVGTAVVQGKLFDISGYPGMLLSAEPGERVVGELHVLTGSASVWASLDAYEGCSAEFRHPHEYVRREVQALLLAEQRWLRAWSWLYNWPVAAQQRILSGDYGAPRQPAIEPGAAHDAGANEGQR